MASPHVAGAAALLWAERPDMDYLQIKAALLDNARPDHLTLIGEGVLDLGASMAAIQGPTEVDIGFAGTAVDVTHNWKTINLPQSFITRSSLPVARHVMGAIRGLFEFKM